MPIPFPHYLEPTKKNIKRYQRAKRALTRGLKRHAYKHNRKFRKTAPVAKDINFVLTAVSLMAFLLYFLQSL
jgi:hypothetical protein